MNKIIFNPIQGIFDYINDVEAEKISKVIEENVSALQIVYFSSKDTFKIAHNNLTEREACGIGMTLTSATQNNSVDVRTRGIVEDAFFNYSNNEFLFLGINGTITNVAPTSGFLTRIGYGLGPGAIFLEIEKPIIL
jgi:hypothetical protein